MFRNKKSQDQIAVDKIRESIERVGEAFAEKEHRFLAEHLKSDEALSHAILETADGQERLDIKTMNAILTFLNHYISEHGDRVDNYPFRHDQIHDVATEIYGYLQYNEWVNIKNILSTTNLRREKNEKDKIELFPISDTYILDLGKANDSIEKAINNIEAILSRPDTHLNDDSHTLFHHLNSFLIAKRNDIFKNYIKKIVKEQKQAAIDDVYARFKARSAGMLSP